MALEATSDFRLPANADSAALLHEIRIEALRIEEDTLHSSKGHWNAAKFWGGIHYWVGGPAFVFAAIAGGTTFSDITWLTASAAFASAVLSAISLFLNPQDRAVTHKRAGDGFHALRNQTRIFRTIESADMSTREARMRLAELARCRDDLNGSSSIIPNRCYKKAKEGIENGEHNYKADAGDEQ